MKNICIFGDSISVGIGAPDGEGWAHHLKKFIEERDPELEVINLAARGEQSGKVLAHIEADCEKWKPEEIILAIGINDSTYSFKEHRARTPREKFEENITAILDIAQKYAKKVVIVGLTRVDERSSTFSDADNVVMQYQNIVIQKFNDSLKGIASTKGVQYIDVYALLSDEELDDGLHPNAAGHAKLFGAIKSQGFA